MSQINTRGLKRYIPVDIAREVRRRCGYGCLICRSAFITYDHFDPEFKDATTHDPDGIVGLCGVHHTARGNGQISVKMIREKLAEFSETKIGDFSKYKFELDNYPEIVIGKTKISGVRKILEIDGKTILSFSPPECAGAPPLLDAMFYDHKGRLCAEIVQNEWRAYAHNWDVVVAGRTYTVRRSSNKTALKLELNEGRITIKYMHLKFNSATVKVDSSGVVTAFTSGSKGSKLVIPSVPTLTQDWFHWIKIDGKQITWCTENIHKLLENTPKSTMPLSLAENLGFSSKKTVMSIPQVVKPSEEIPDEWENDNNHGDFEKITLNEIALCPHSHSNGTTMYAFETRTHLGHISSPVVSNLNWVRSARKAEDLILANPLDTKGILSLIESAIVEFESEGGKVKQWLYLMSRKIESLNAAGMVERKNSTYEEMLMVAPKRFHADVNFQRAKLLVTH